MTQAEEDEIKHGGANGVTMNLYTVWKQKRGTFW